MIIVTGATGFIGSNLLVEMEKRGFNDIIAVDWFGNSEKWKNIETLFSTRFIFPEQLDDILKCYEKRIEAIIHLGGISSTIETNADLIVKNNNQLSIKLYEFCKSLNIPFIYASSAATYGNGSKGFSDNDDIEYLKKLKPQNLYGWSKCYIDRFIAQDLSKNKNTTQVVGLKFFNVYGPNEYHKKGQTSVMYKFYKELRDTHKIKLFKSYHTAYRDGEQQRDFVYVDDCVDVILWMLAHSSVKGLFNVGTGQARTFIDIANIINSHFDNIADIEFIEMPLALQRHYQYHTCADISKLRMVGYKNTFHTIEEGINKYINFLKQIN
nr:ADP-glyceromanno-heptose 6-epimerase [Prevotella sp.]